MGRSVEESRACLRARPRSNISGVALYTTSPGQPRTAPKPFLGAINETFRKHYLLVKSDGIGGPAERPLKSRGYTIGIETTVTCKNGAH